jgi:hypothetical protein
MRALIALAFVLAGCAPLDLNFDMYVDRRFELREQCLAREAIARWEHATGGLVDVPAYLGLRYTSLLDARLTPYPHQIERASEHDSRWPSDVAFGATIGDAAAPGRRGRILISPPRIARRYPDQYEAIFLHTIMHELGHKFGLEHRGAGLMAPGVSGDDYGCITREDLAQFCELWGCSLIAPACAPAPTMCEALTTIDET